MIKRCLLLLLLLMPMAVSAQSDCHKGVPCGPVPWSIPQFPFLQTPTPFPTVLATSGPGSSPTPTGTLTPAPTPTATPGIDLVGVNDQMSTLQSVVAATPPGVQDRSQGFDLGHNANNVFNYILGLQSIHFGVFTPLIQLIFFGFFFVVGLKITIFLLPVFATLFGWIRKMVELVLDFIPG